MKNQKDQKKKVTKADVLDFIKKHKLAIGGGVLVLIGTITGCKLIAKSKNSSVDGEQLLESIIKDLPGDGPIIRNYCKNAKAIDEAIYCDLADDLESVLIDKGISEAIIQRSYDLGEGNLSKLVTIKVEQVCNK